MECITFAVVLGRVVHDLVQALRAGEVREICLAEACVERTRQGLTACDESSPSPPSVPVVLLVLLCRVRHVRLDDLLDIANLNQHILRLQIGVDDAAFSVQVV